MALVSGLVVIVVLLQFSGLVPSVVATARAASSVDFHVGYLQAVDSLNPFMGQEDASYVFYSMVYDFLFSPDQDGNWVPNLAVSASCDAVCMNWTYVIRQGVNWNDPQNPTVHNPLTADDVNFTINFNIQNFFQLWAYQPYVNRIVQCSAQTKPHCGAAQTGPWQVTVYFDRPFAPGKTLLIPILQRAQWQGISAAQAQSHFTNSDPIGTGPFIADPNIYTEWTNGQPLHLTKNPSYHDVGTHTGSAAIDNMYLEQFSTEATLVSALESGQVDLAKFTPYGYNAVAGQPHIAEQQDLISTNEWNEIGFSQYDASSADKSLNPARWDINVRRALAMATNKDHIIQSIYDGKGLRGDSLTTAITPQSWYDPTTDPGANLTFNVQAANALLNRSGYTVWSGGSFGQGVREAAHNIFMNITTNACSCASPTPVTKEVLAGTALSFSMAVRQEFPVEQDTANYLVAAWAQVGVQVTPQVMLESALSAAVFGGSVDTYIWYWSGGGPDPNYLLSIASGYTLNGWSDSYWNNVSYNNLYVQQLAALNVTQRMQIVRAAEKIQYESAVYIIYIVPYGQWAYRTDTFAGWGDWVAHPYRQFDAYYGANPLFLDLQPNHPPTTPAILSPVPPVTVFTGTSLTFAGNSTDIDPSETLTWTWSWGDGTSAVHAYSSSVSQDTASHTWASPGTVSVTLSVNDGGYNVTSAPFSVQVVARPADTGWINGSVMDAHGSPIAGASVSTDPGGFSNTADAAGHYSLDVGVGTYSVTASASLYQNATVAGVSVVKDGVAYVNFTLAVNRGWIAGAVSSTAGGPLEGAVILLYASNGRQSTAATGADGSYNLSVQPGTYAVSASATGYVSQNRTGQTVTLGQTTREDFQLTPSAASGLTLSAIELIGLGGAAAVILVGVGAFLVVRRRKRSVEKDKLELKK